MTQEDAKRAAAVAAASLVESGMLVGLGSGSTILILVDALGRTWKVDEESLPKRPYKIALMYIAGATTVGATTVAMGTGIHVAGQELVLRYLEDILSSSSRAAIVDVPS